MDENDESLSELELKSFWYKSDKKAFVKKWIWLCLSQFLTIFDEPKTQLKLINMVTRVCNAHKHSTSCNQLKSVAVLAWLLPADSMALRMLRGSANEAHVAEGSGEPWFGVLFFNGHAITSWSAKL